MDRAKPRAVQTECHNRTIGGTCKCKPKCVKCGYGPHMGVHMGTLKDPTRAFDHEYTPLLRADAVDTTAGEG